MSEAIKLSWDWSDPFAVSINIRYPTYVIDGDAQKSGKSEVLPIAPEYVAMLKKVPQAEQEGPALDWPFTVSWTKKVISSIGIDARIKVNASGKFASANDYRRSFGTRWSPRLSPADLKQLMRHAAIATTMEYYVDMPANDLGARLWGAVAQNGAVESASGASAAQRPFGGEIRERGKSI